MTKQEAESIIKGEKSFDQVFEAQTSQPEANETVEPVENTEPTATETDNVDTSNQSGTEEETSVSSDKVDEPEKLKDDAKNTKVKKYSQIEKQRHAFAKEKDRRREVEARLSAKQKEIEELQEKLKKYEGLKLEHFNGDNEAYTDYKIDQRMNSERVSRLQSEYNQEQMAMQAEEAQKIAEYRLQTNFPEEESRNKYQSLIQQAETDYASMHPEIGYEKFSDFLLSEQDRTVIQFLQDSDNSPKLIRHFIHKPEAALRIMQMRNPYNKIVELKQLENRMLQYERVQASKQKTVQPKRELPNTGKVVTTSTINNGVDWSKPFSKQDAVNYFKNKNKQ